MANLSFFYGEMGCGKTAKLIEDVKKAKKNGKKTIVSKPKLDTKNGKNLLSRNGKTCEVDYLIDRGDDLFTIFGDMMPADELFIDEAQFLDSKQIDQLLLIATKYNIPVNTYGLRLNFYLGDENFAGATRLLQIAHQLVCLESMCDICHKEQAIFSCVFVNGKLQTSGPSILISDGTKVVDAHAMCAKCYHKFLADKDQLRIAF